MNYDWVFFCLQFLHVVENVEPQLNSVGKTEWIVTVKDLQSGNKTTKVYDAVMVCNGYN